MSGNNSTPNNSNLVLLNVGGRVFQTTKDSLSQDPDSFLARLIHGDIPSEKDESGAYLIDYNPAHMRTIFNCLRKKKPAENLFRAISGNNSAPNNSDLVRLNVGGKLFQTTKDTLSRYPESFLARLIKGDLPSVKDESGAYFVDSDPKHFRTILTYLRRGVLNLDGDEKTTKDLLSEAGFYKIQPLVDEIRKAMR